MTGAATGAVAGTTVDPVLLGRETLTSVLSLILDARGPSGRFERDFDLEADASETVSRNRIQNRNWTAPAP